MTAPATPTEVALHLAGLARDLDTTVRQLEDADREAVEKRGAADLAYSRAFLAAEGSVESRKHRAVVETHQQRMAADVAEAVVRHLRRRVDAIKTRIDVGRSYSAAIRAELSLENTRVET